VKERNPKSEIRNPKSEGNPKSEIRRKPETRNPNEERVGLFLLKQTLASGARPVSRQPQAGTCGPRSIVFSLQSSDFGFRISDFLRFSVFGFRISVFSLQSSVFSLRFSDFHFRLSFCALALLAAQTPLLATSERPAPDTIPPLRPPLGEIPPTFLEQHSLLVIFLGVLLLALLGVVVWWLSRPRPAAVVRPETQARQALEPLREQPEDGAVLSRISQILRRYVGAAIGLPQGELTTADFCRTIADNGRLGPELSGTLGDFLQKCDEHKFAPPVPRPALGAVACALKIIEVAEVRCAQSRQIEAQPGRAYRGRPKP